MAPDAPALILASGSAARRALLEAAGIAFRAVPSDVDEAAIKRAMRGRDAAAVAMALAEAKASCGAHADAVVIGADQILVCDGATFDKPADLGVAREQLRRLRGRRHALATAVCCWRGGGVAWRHLAQPVLTMRAFSDAFLDAYLAAEGEAVLGCVGAYRLEGLGVQLFDHVEGDHAAILGLPLLPLLAFLRRSALVLA
jgi:septum formation protein